MKKKKVMPNNLRRLIMSLLIAAGAALVWKEIQERSSGEVAFGIQQGCQIQAACQTYARTHAESFPQTLEELVNARLLDPKTFDLLTGEGRWRYYGADRLITENDFILAVSSKPVWNEVTSSRMYVKIHSRAGVTLEDDASAGSALPSGK